MSSAVLYIGLIYGDTKYELALSKLFAGMING
jgi:hypothetical protein